MRKSEVTYRFALESLAWSKLEGSARPERVKKNRLLARQYAPTDKLDQRVELSERLSEIQQGGKVPVYSWGRDCDQCESDSVTLIPATVMAFLWFADRTFRYAEGPVQVYPISFAEYAEFEPSFRDRRAEQYNY